MAEWIYFIHPPRDDFAETMTEAEGRRGAATGSASSGCTCEGRIVLVGPTLGRVNTGICVFEADDEAAALELMHGDPAIAEGFATGELRPMRVSLLRGRDEARVAASLAAIDEG